MDFQTEYAEMIQDRCISGFRRYRLQEPISLVFASQNLCDMTGYTKEELTDGDADGYACLVHPADRGSYRSFLHRVCGDGQQAVADYRLIRKDGRILYVRDTLTAKQAEDGMLIGCSVLCDITSLKAENENLRFLNETVPCGFLKFTCEKHPKVTYVNEQMLKIMRLPESKDGEMDYRELYQDNIYLTIPMEERRKFSHFLNQVYAKGSPIAGELSVLRGDGTKARLYGWVTKQLNEEGDEEFQSVCMDVTERYHTKRATQTERYLKALSEVYDSIFEYDFSNQTVTYLYSRIPGLFDRIRHIPMHLPEATEQWLQSTVCEEDRVAVRAFMEHVTAQQTAPEDSRPPQIRFRTVSTEGSPCPYTGIFLKIDASISLFCCRSLSDEIDADHLRNEISSLKNRNANMQEMVMRFTDGIAAFEVTNDRVTPLYASDNICDFFGFTKDEWLPMMKQSNSIREFVSRSGVGYEKFSELLERGEAEFSYWDITTGAKRSIKAICSQKNASGVLPRYVMLYQLDDPRRKTAGGESRPGIYIRTFGYFDVFVGDKPIAFRNKKAKELLALLVDRRGGYITSEEAIGFLWENEPVNAVTLSRYRKEALRLKNTLEEHGIADVMESVDGKRRIVTEKVRCDLYDYLSGKEEFAPLFKGSYLTNYSWGEITLGELLSKIPKDRSED